MIYSHCTLIHALLGCQMEEAWNAGSSVRHVHPWIICKIWVVFIVNKYQFVYIYIYIIYTSLVSLAQVGKVPGTSAQQQEATGNSSFRLKDGHILTLPLQQPHQFDWGKIFPNLGVKMNNWTFISQKNEVASQNKSWCTRAGIRVYYFLRPTRWNVYIIYIYMCIYSRRQVDESRQFRVVSTRHPLHVQSSSFFTALFQRPFW